MPAAKFESSLCTVLQHSSTFRCNWCSLGAHLKNFAEPKRWCCTVHFLKIIVIYIVIAINTTKYRDKIFSPYRPSLLVGWSTKISHSLVVTVFALGGRNLAWRSSVCVSVCVTACVCVYIKWLKGGVAMGVAYCKKAVTP